MNFHTEGLLLSRRSLKEIDETLTFFTQKCGKIACVAYGVKSPRSRRGRLLHVGRWHTIALRRRHEIYTLEAIRPLHHLNSTATSAAPKDTTLLLADIIRNTLDMLPQELPSKEIYTLLKQTDSLLEREETLKASLDFRRCMFYYGLLKLMGIFPTCHDLPKERAQRQADSSASHRYNRQTQRYEPISEGTFSQIKGNADFPALTQSSLAFLNAFETHFDLSPSFYFCMYRLFITWQEQAHVVNLKALCHMGRLLLQVR